jgi:hypothetical protein
MKTEQKIRTIVTISTGEKTAMRTLRVIRVGENFYRSQYIRNLCRDGDEAIEKARAYFEANKKHWPNPMFDPNGATIELNGWGEIPTYQRKMLEMIKQGFMPFGKHRGVSVKNLPDGYVLWFAKQSADNTLGSAVIDALVEEANERNLFAAEEARLAEIEAQKARSTHIGEIGDRGKFRVKVEKVLTFHGGRFGTSYMNLCRDEFGRKVVYKGTKGFEAGTTVEMIATVKDHGEYQGEKQTYISRPTKIEVVETEELEAA